MLLFKAERRKYGVPTIHGYKDVDSEENYPVIVKTANRAGSIGVGIAYNRNELEKAYEIAVEKSLVKKLLLKNIL